MKINSLIGLRIITILALLVGAGIWFFVLPNFHQGINDYSFYSPVSKGKVAAAITENVSWTNLVNSSASGTTLSKTGGCDGCNVVNGSGATSSQRINSADGYLEFSPGSTTATRHAGLGTDTTNNTDSSHINFAITLAGSIAEVRESGAYRTETTYSSNDIFRVAIQNGAIKYYKNGNLFYTSSLSPVYPLAADVSLINNGATITNATISYTGSGGSYPTPYLTPYATPYATPQYATPSSSSSDPELPRIYLDTTFPSLPSGRTVRNVRSNCSGFSDCVTNLQTAIDAAVPGDEIVLEAGASFAGPFTVPSKSNPGNQWIIFRSSSLSNLPAGLRVSPGKTASMAKLTKTSNGEPIVKFLPGANHYRLSGLEITANANVTQVNNLVLIGEASITSQSQLPNNIVIDRSYIHAHGNLNTQRCIGLNAATSSVIDSYVSECHFEGADAQAIGGWNGAGPYKITNNYLEGSGENLMFGGADPAITNIVPADIEIRNNYFYKPLSWKIGHPSYAGRAWSIKNLFELKAARRVLIDGNIFENNWTQAQAGVAIVLKSANQDGGCSGCVTENITFTNNIVRHAGGALTVSAAENEQGGGRPPVANRIKIANVLFDDISDAWAGSAGASRGYFITGGADRITIEHTTLLESYNILFGSDDGIANNTNLVFKNNIVERGLYGIGAGGEGTTYLNNKFSPYIFQKNVLINTSGDSNSSVLALYPQGQTAVATGLAGVGFVNWQAGQTNFQNYALASTSQYKNTGTDGKDPGIDAAALNSATSCVIVGNCSGGSYPTPYATPYVTPYTTPYATPTTNARPTGSLDGVNVSAKIVFGWAQDPDNTSVPILVHMYFDKNAGTAGAAPVLCTASDGRNDVGAHAFNCPVPTSLQNGASHQVWVWAIDLTDPVNNNSQLPGSPKTFTIAASTYATPYATPYVTPSTGGGTYSTPYATPASSGGSGGGSSGGNSSPGVISPTASIKLVNESGTYYVIHDGKRFGVTNPGLLFSYGLEFKDAVDSTPADNAIPYTDNLKPGEGSLVKKAGDGTVWLISDGQRHGFTDDSVFLELGFQFDHVLEVPAKELDVLAEGPLLNNSEDPHQAGVYINQDGTIYRINADNTKSGVPDLAVWNSLNPDNDFSRVVPANSADRNLPTGNLLSARGTQ